MIEKKCSYGCKSNPFKKSDSFDLGAGLRSIKKPDPYAGVKAFNKKLKEKKKRLWQRFLDLIERMGEDMKGNHK